MVYLLNALSPGRSQPRAAERRRVVVIGAGRTGMAAAFHLGEHSLLLERQQKLEDIDDQSHTVPMGDARSGAVAPEEPGATPQSAGISAAERKALFISCSSTGEAGTGASSLIHVARWQPPELSPATERDEYAFAPTARALAPLLRGELRLATEVVRITPSRHLLEVADGGCIVYDTLLSSIPLTLLAGMAIHELPAHVRSNDGLRWWLGENDIEVADRATQVCCGDVDGFAAGKRLADRINTALEQRFGVAGRALWHGSRFFEPRLVEKASPGM